ncbi:hypothetical protein ABH926_004925 [Catenulispora sp. GP43]|uniref:hypothetical protein n=1 Tax=Catenulispora sp. GP43 TaxID=3156263 RepID=UPI0035182B26
MTMLWISTDVDDFTGVVREAARVLAPGGLPVLAGVHPCFVGPHVEFREDGGHSVHPTYRLAEPERLVPFSLALRLRRPAASAH